MTPLSFDALPRFRLNLIGIIADIEKAYLQVSVADLNWDFLRFFRFDDVFKDISEKVKFQFYGAVFGAKCSKHLLNSVVRYHDRKFPEKVAKFFTLMISILLFKVMQKVKRC